MIFPMLAEHMKGLLSQKHEGKHVFPCLSSALGPLAKLLLCKHTDSEGATQVKLGTSSDLHSLPSW